MGDGLGAYFANPDPMKLRRAIFEQIMERIMRILLCGVAAVALSGCSWLGYSTEGYANGPGYNPQAVQSGSYYNPTITTNRYSADVYDKAGYQYPVATTYPMDYDHGGQLVGNTMYPAATHHAPAQHTSGQYGTQHYGGHNTVPRENRWTVNGAIGTEISTGGQIFSGENAAGFAYNNLSMDEVYKPGLRAELGAARSLKGNRMLTMTGFYSKAEGEQVALRETPQNIVVGKMSDHESYGAELGLRQYVSMPASSQYKPYVEGRVGGAYVDDISLDDVRLSTSPDTANRSFSFIEGGWVPTGAALIGVERPISSNAMLGLETGIRYSGGLDADTIAPANSALAGAAQYEERWSVPISLRGRYRF